MPLTHDSKETIRAQRDAKFRHALLCEAVECVINGEVATGKAVLRDYVNATVGFSNLEKRTRIPAKSLMRMLGPKGSPSAVNLSSILTALQKSTLEGQQLATCDTLSGNREPKWKSWLRSLSRGSVRYFASAFLLAALAAPVTIAGPIYYVIDFNPIVGYGGATMPTGSFDYDSTTETFSNFIVVVGDRTGPVTFDFTSVANNPSIPSGAVDCTNGATGGAFTFLLFLNCPTSYNYGEYVNSTNYSFSDVYGFAEFSFDVVENLDGTLYNAGPLYVGEADPNCTGGCLVDQEGLYSLTPEPSSVIFLSTGLLAVAFWKRNRSVHT